MMMYIYDAAAADDDDDDDDGGGSADGYDAQGGVWWRAQAGL